MEVEAFLLCDCATDQIGKLNVLGAFDTIFANNVPTKYPACSIAARIRFSKAEEGEHKVRINVIDQDGKQIAPKLEAPLNVRFRQGVYSSAVNLILNFHQLQLADYGDYRIDLAVDGNAVSSLPLFLRKRPQKPNQQQL